MRNLYKEILDTFSEDQKNCMYYMVNETNTKSVTEVAIAYLNPRIKSAYKALTPTQKTCWDYFVRAAAIHA